MGVAMGRKTTFEVPPPCLGLTTVMETVSLSGCAPTVAFSWELLTNVAVSGLPFQFTSEPDTKPVPFTVSMKGEPPGPGATASGTSGWLTNGTGFGRVSVILAASDLVGSATEVAVTVTAELAGTAGGAV